MASPLDDALSSLGGSAPAPRSDYGSAPSPALADALSSLDEPTAPNHDWLDAVEGGLHTALTPFTLPKQGVDWLARQGSRALGLPVADNATVGQMARSAAGLSQGDEGYAGKLEGRALEFGADVGLDPLTYTGLGLPGKAGKLASAGFAANMGIGALKEGRQAYDTLLRSGLTPEAAEQVLGTVLSGTMAGVAGTHALSGEPAPASVPEPLPAPIEAPTAPPGPVVTASQASPSWIGGPVPTVPPEFLTTAPGPLSPPIQAPPLTPRVEGNTAAAETGAPPTPQELTQRTAALERGDTRGAEEVVPGPVDLPAPGPDQTLPPLSPEATQPIPLVGPDGAPAPVVEPAPLASSSSGPPPQPVAGAPVVPEESAPVQAEPLSMERGPDRRVDNVPAPEERRTAIRRAELALEGGVPEDHPLVQRVLDAEAHAENASQDELTGVGTGSAYHRAVASGKPAAVSEIDVAGAGATNKQFGEKYTDARLAAAGQTLKAIVGDRGQVFRKGGDEFVVHWNDAAEGAAAHPELARALQEAHVIVRGADGKAESAWTGVEHYAGFGHDFDTASREVYARKPHEGSPEYKAIPRGLPEKIAAGRENGGGLPAGDAGVRQGGESGPGVPEVPAERNAAPEGRTELQRQADALAELGWTPEQLRLRNPSPEELQKIIETGEKPGYAPDGNRAMATNLGGKMAENTPSQSVADRQAALAEKQRALVAAAGEEGNPLFGGEGKAESLPKTGTERYSAQPNKQGFFSQLSRAVDETKQPAASGSNWSAYLRDQKRGVKAEEMKWTGLDDFLAERKGQKVTKQEIQDFLKQNEVQVKETTLGNAPAQKELEAAHDKLIKHLVDDQEFTQRGATDYALDAARGDLSESQLEALKGDGLTRKYVDRLKKAYNARNTSKEEQPTKFGQYQEPGGENYRELLLKTPAGRRAHNDLADWEFRQSGGKWRGQRKDGDGRDAWGSTLEDAKADAVTIDGKRDRSDFRSSHFEEPNILAHVRFNERTDADGKRVLFLEEVQSDWAQKGRREGFRPTPAREKELRATIAEMEALGRDATPEQKQRWADAMTELQPERPQKAPQGPFVGKTEAWSELAMKRMIRWAAENGFDKIAWTKGEQQAARYDLSKQLSKVDSFYDTNSNDYTIKGFDHGGKRVVERVVSREELPDVVGKELADKIVSGADQGSYKNSYSGLDLRVGGEGMKGFYDKILPAIAGKLGKKFGATVGETQLPGVGDSTFSVREMRDGSWMVKRGEMAVKKFPTEEEANAFVRRDAAGGGVHSMDITPEMRRSVTEQGQPLFAADKGAPSKPLTVERVRAAIPGLDFQTEADGSHVAKLKNGGELRVSPVGEIEVTNQKALAESAQAGGVEGEATPVGSYQRIGKDALIQIAKEAPAGTEHHEGFHFVFDQALSPKEREAVLKKYGDEESAAYAYQEWTPKTINGWFSKILQYAQRIYRTFRPTWDSVFEETRSGRAGKRIAGESSPESGPRFAAGEDARRDSNTRRPGESVADFTKRQMEHARTPEARGEAYAEDQRMGAALRGSKFAVDLEAAKRARDDSNMRRPGESIADFTKRQMENAKTPGAKALAYAEDQRMGDALRGEPKYATAVPPKPTAAAAPAKPKPTFADKLIEGWRSGLVSAPGTQLANPVSNVLEAGVRSGESVLAGFIDKALGGQRSRFSGEALEQIKGGLSSMPEAAKTLSDGLKNVLQDDPNFPGKIEGKTGAVVRVPLKLLGVGDATTATMNEGAVGRSLAYRQAKQELPQGTKADIETRQQQIMANPTPAMKDAIKAEVADRQFKAPNEPDSMLKMLLDLRNKHKWLNAVIPFVETPANIAKLAIQRSPVGFKKAFTDYKAYKAALNSGVTGPELSAIKGRAVDSLARPIMGTTILGLFGAYAKAGGMTGSGPTDPKQQALLKETGWQPYSFKVGNTYIPYNRFEPVSSILGIAADMAELKDQKKAGDMFDKGLGSIMSNLTSKTYLQGLADASAMIANPKQFASQYVSGLAGSLVPNIVAKVAQTIDPKMRDTKPSTTGLLGIPEKIGKTVAARIPGLSEMLPAQKTATGQDRERQSAALFRLLSPIQPTTERADRGVEKLLVDVNAIPSQPSRDFTVPGTKDNKKLHLNDQEYAILQESNKTATDYIRKRFLGNSAFLKLDPEDQKRRIERVYEQARSAARDKLRSRRDFRQRLREASV